MPQIYTTKEGDMVDAIAFEHYGRHRGTTEAIYEANRGLAAHPLVLPAGLNITLPDLDETQVNEPVRGVALYD